MKLSFEKTAIKYQINEEERETLLTEFLIDHKPLSEIIGIERSLCFYETEFDYSKDRKSMAIKQFMGEFKPINQFTSDRIILYRCHCGCDYCGVISFRLVIENNIVIWKDIAYEDSDGFGNNSQEGLENEERITTKITELSFDKKDYFAELIQIGKNNWN
ncbi:MAG: hypothetical protein WBP45_07285 [Daejeonella sp.]